MSPRTRDPRDRHGDGCDAIRAAEAAGEVADSLDVRMALIRRMDAGELTLAEVLAEVARLKRAAKKSGKITRSQAYRRGAR